MTNPTYPLNVLEARAALADPEAVVEDMSGYLYRWKSGAPPTYKAPELDNWIPGVGPHFSGGYRLLPKEGADRKEKIMGMPGHLAILGDELLALAERVEKLDKDLSALASVVGALNGALAQLKYGGGGDE